MKIKLLILTLLAGGALSIQAGAQTCCTNKPWKPVALTVEAGQNGNLPYSYMTEEPVWSTANQIEIWQVSGARQKMFARVWCNDKTLLRDWDTDRVYLRGPGPGGLKIFPAGNYVARWRGWNPCGYGDWSDPPTPFTVGHDGNLEVEIIQESSGEAIWAVWSNNFVASKSQIEIRRGTKVVRKTTISSGYGYWYAPFDDEDLKVGTYEDYASSPAKELPDGTGYVFRVKSYSPVLKKWSDWIQTEPFSLARSAPVLLPYCGFSQADYVPLGYWDWNDEWEWVWLPPENPNPFFDKSPRPYFYASYGNQTPLWTFFEIKQKVGTRLKVVRKQWVSGRQLSMLSYGYAAFEGIGGVTSPTGWAKDLPVGEYVWRVQAWNGPGAGQSEWTAPVTSHVVAAGALEPPDPSSIDMQTFVQDKRQTIKWEAVPNAYRYNVEMRRNGKPFRKVMNLDAGKNIWLWQNESIFQVDWHLNNGWLPNGIYTFRVQAVNKANPKDQQVSDWSAPSSEFEVNTVPPRPAIWGQDAGESWVWMYADIDWELEQQYQIVDTRCPKFTVSLDVSGASLPPGFYKWRVRQRNAWKSWSPWSDWSEEFEVTSP